MGQKLIRFEAIRQFANVLEYPAGMPGQWGHSLKRPPHQPGACLREGGVCGRLGRLYKNQNFLGVDLKGNRIWKGAKTALDEAWTTLVFADGDRRSRIIFAAGEVSEIWITFPDPQLRFSKMKKRLTHPRFLRAVSANTESGRNSEPEDRQPRSLPFHQGGHQLYGLALLQDLDNVYQSPRLRRSFRSRPIMRALILPGPIPFITCNSG